MNKKIFTTSAFLYLSMISASAWAAPKCDSLLALKSGITTDANGRVSIQAVESSRPGLATAVNKSVTAVAKKPLKLDSFSEATKRLLEDTSEEPFFVKLSKAFRYFVDLEGSAGLDKIPKEGPVVIYVNHPSNAKETIALASLIAKIRPDLKVAMNDLLTDFPGIQDNAYLLKLYGGQEALVHNKKVRQQMSDDLSKGRAILVHLSGEVSTLANSTDGHYAMDPEWKIGALKMIKDVPDAKVVTIFVDGQASDAYLKFAQKSQNPGVLAKVRQSLMPVMHLRELAPEKEQAFLINVGSPVLAKDVLEISQGNMKSAAELLRARTYALKGRFEKTADNRVLEPIAEKGSEELIRQDIERMSFLFEENGLRVVIAEGRQIPNLLNEIGRLREVAFRSVKEASGKSRDLDSYDQHYQHVLVYRPESGAIIGAYRISPVDLALSHGGLKGLYTHSLLDMTAMAPKVASRTIELGRAFANPELDGRDRRLAVHFLPMIWKGLAHFIEKNPQYTNLIGPVSFSNAYSDVSKIIMSQYLMKSKSGDDSYKGSVKARTPFQPKSPVIREALIAAQGLRSLNDLNKLITDIDGEGIPSLVKSYDKLGAQYLQFNFDADFNSLDGLIIVDLLKSPADELVKYFGEEGLQRFYNHHGVNKP